MVYNFFHVSGKRNQVLSTIVNDAGKAELKLKAFCNTLWWYSYEALRAFNAQFFEVSKALEQIVDEDPKAEPQANGLLSTMHTYKFIFALVLMLEVFKISNVLSNNCNLPRFSCQNHIQLLMVFY